MKKIILFIGIGSAAIFAGESVGLIENLKLSSKQYSFKSGVSKEDQALWNRSLESNSNFIQAYEPKLYSKFQILERSSSILFNIINTIHKKYILKAQKQLDDNPFDTIVDKAIISGIEQQIQPLHAELKKIKALPTGPFFKKSEPQKAFNAAKDILVKRVEQVINEFKEFKKNPIIN